MTNFKDKVVYQIYPKSFYDADGDGLGDLRGVTAKLDYLAELGVDYLWLTPFFPSPQRDNGYDVADYCAVDPRFGTMADLEELIAQADKRGIGLMFDMVFNHTSTEHEWFQKALAGDETYQNYYIFKDGDPDAPPTNWVSKFGGSAWEYLPSLKKWYLHLFDVSQADLNWENPAVRAELAKVLRFWKEKGVKGFRFDVVNLISKPEVFEDDHQGDGRRFYTDGRNVHRYLQELVAAGGIDGMVTVGEMSSTTLENCIGYTAPDRHELSMCFNFHHLKVDYKNGDKWALMPPDRHALKELFAHWQEGMQAHDGWNALFWCNHDQPRAVSRFGNDGRYWAASAKMLGVATHCMRGTPYIYQGEELGMTNAHFTTIGQYRDVESLNYYRILQEQGHTASEALEILAARSRDNGRTPMQWNAEPHAGFTTGTPWIGVVDNYKSINAAAQVEDPDSIFRWYRTLIALRKQYKVISEGRIQMLMPDDDALLAYRRWTDDEELLVVCNLTADTAPVTLPEGWQEARRLLGNYPAVNLSALRPYECVVLYREAKH
ncbi:MAG TPA: alpha,alpha-phosphotrehalase [Candidatus Gemmiger excrementavium]|uniref:Alpha,alpha-phosphotrehalase n=1 Tax=Candidatus Gemmiger excrementavium TaxID=2838608 RepID=A0A9D2F1Y0_9FIRM|nr:alpha,alpha-phosphotrehalase [Candidatus Gemmiger excrementavium]